MNYFKTILATDETYHIFNRSLIGKQVYKDKRCYDRFLTSMDYYQMTNPPIRLAYFLKTPQKPKIDREKRFVDILCYCLMPNHFHLMLTQLAKNGISIFINRLLNSYTHYYNTRYKRKGPLWQGRFKRLRIDSDEQLLHLTRYIHLNPVTDYLIEDPCDYSFSSYNEYIKSTGDKISQPEKVLGKNYSPEKYKQFVLNQKDYQRTLKEIKDTLIE